MTIDFFFFGEVQFRLFLKQLFFSLLFGCRDRRVHPHEQRWRWLNTVLCSDISQSQSTDRRHRGSAHWRNDHIWTKKTANVNYLFIFFNYLMLVETGGISWIRLLAEVSCQKVKIKLQTIISEVKEASLCGVTQISWVVGVCFPNRVMVQQGQQRDQCLRTSSSLKIRCVQLVS